MPRKASAADPTAKTGRRLACSMRFCFVACALATFELAAAAQEGADDPLVPLVSELLQDKDRDIRSLGYEQVRRQAKGEAATRKFAALLPKLASEAQAGLLAALADRGDAAARPAVVDRLASPDKDVRAAAIAALGALGEAADVERLVQLLAAEGEVERKAARQSLERLPGETIAPAIAAQLESAGSDTRVVLLDILATRHAGQTVPAILPWAIDDDAAVRAAAMAALGELAGPEHLPDMLHAVLRAEVGGERAAAEKAVMRVCGRIEDPRLRADPLLAAMRQFQAADQTALLPALGRIGGAAARKTIEAAIAAADPATHETGIVAICHWPDASIAPRIMELAQSDEHAACRTRALRALIRIAPLPDERSDGERLALLQEAMAMCTRDEERILALARARAIRTIETLRFVAPYMDQAAYAEAACETIVELAHHRGLREPHKAEFDAALDKVRETSKDPVVLERADRYKKGQTWARPTAGRE